jgi:cellulose synthase/poly-beta-1,6-N-acetylglucosamine synthase-like glycosyltransferase
MKITVSIPYYNRADMVMETIMPLLFDDRIDEIILCDDCSPEDDFCKLLENISDLEQKFDEASKIKVIKNVENFHNQHNKRNAISFAKNEWVLILDNDNIADKNFIDKFYKSTIYNNIIFHPAFAAPTFDYRIFNGHTITKENVNIFTKHNIFITLCNTNNYFVNRDEYLRVYQYDKTVRGADGIYFTYQWLKAGNEIYIVPDMEYFHRVHDGSEFLRESDSNMKLIYYWLDKIKGL